jgi:hypothetical protein
VPSLPIQAGLLRGKHGGIRLLPAGDGAERPRARLALIVDHDPVGLDVEWEQLRSPPGSFDVNYLDVKRLSVQMS